MKKKQKFCEVWVGQTELGNRYDMTAVALGKVLVRFGLKSGPKPTERAMTEGYCRYVPLKDGRDFWMWHSAKVSDLMKQSGATKLSEQEQEARRIARELFVLERTPHEKNPVAYKCWDGIAYDTPRELRPLINHFLEQAGAYRLVNPHG